MGAVRARLKAELRSRWKAWGAIALLIGLMGGVVLTTAAGARRTDTAYSRYLGSSRAADLLVSPVNTGLTGWYDAIRRLPDVETMTVGVGIATFAPGRDSELVQVLASADEQGGRTIERPKIVAGRMFRPDKPFEAVADRSLARSLNIHAGSKLEVLAAPTSESGPDLDNAYPISFDIVGVGVTRENVVPVSALASQPTLLATPAFFEQLKTFYKDRSAATGKDIHFQSYDGAFVRLQPGTSRTAFARQAESLAGQFPDAGTPIFVSDQHEQAAKVQKAIRPQATALALFSLLAAVAALFVIGQILSRQLFLASGDDPTLRAMGLTRSQLLTIHLGEVAIVAAAGGVLALVIAAAASPLMPIGPARIAEPHPGLAVNWAILGLGALAIVVLLLLREAWPAWRLSSVHGGVQGAAEVEGGDRPSRLLEAATKAGAPASAAVGVRLALEPGRGRTAVPVRSALAGTVLAIAAVAAAFTFGTNLVRLVRTPKLYGQEFDLVADTGFGKLERAKTDAFLASHQGVATWTYGDYTDLEIGRTSVAGIALAKGQGTELWPRIIEGRAPSAPDELIVGTKSLKAIHRSVGDTVEVTSDLSEEARTMRIVGRATFPFFGRGAFGTLGLGEGAAMQDPAPPRGFEDEATKQSGFNFVLAGVDPRANKAATVSSLRKDLADSRVCPEDQECGILTLRRPVDILNYSRIQTTPLALAAVLGLLALATIAHLLITSTRRRRRDLAVLKTLGFVRGQVSAAVAWQATTLVVLAVLVGIPLGVAAGRWIWQVFADQLGVPPDSRIPIVSVLLLIPAAVVVANVLAAGPGWVAGRLKPAPVLRTE